MSLRRRHSMPFGAELDANGRARFRLWAPAREQVALELIDDAELKSVPMTRDAQGWHRADVDRARAGLRYRYRLDAELAVPDPASRYNPLDVHGPSELIDPLAYAWNDHGWKGRPWHEAVIYELHVGGFTPAGTFADARARLAELAALGITAIELMPVADFPGRRNWGYDGVLPYAPDASYGHPDDLKRLVDTAHGLGLMVLLDVVYNHFGPEGNYLHAYAPQFFAQAGDGARQTPWGAALNFDGPSSAEVRAFFVHNALYWVEEFGFDGLRLDAVHAIEDRSSPDIVESIAQALADGPGRERHVHLVLENDRNQARYLGGAGRASAQWNDDVHHALHVIVTGETDGYYADYADDVVGRLARALAEGFVYQGEPSAFRGGARRGEPSAQLPPSAFVNFVQSHDQVGNRAFGDRIDAIADAGLMPAALACVLLAPPVPMLFMGEEYGASTPFLFFCDFGAELAAAVSRGRREEFGRFAAFRDPAARAAIPDPNARDTFTLSKLRWTERVQTPHRERLALVRRMLEVRYALMPRLGRIAAGGRYRVEGQALAVHWRIRGANGANGANGASEAGELVLQVNFGDEPVPALIGTTDEVLFSFDIEPVETRGGAAPMPTTASAGDWQLARGGVLLALHAGGVERIDG